MISRLFFSKKQDSAFKQSPTSKTLSLSLLSNFAPFNELSTPQAFKNILAYAQAKGVQLKKGKSLLSIPDSDDLDFYLIEGAVTLVANDGRSENITSESPKAQKPLAYLRPRKYEVVVVSNAAVLMVVPHHLVQLIYTYLKSEKGSQTHEPSYDQVLNPSELESVYGFFRNQQWEQESCLVTPISISKAMWVGCLQSKGEQDLSKVVHKDVALSAKLIKIARGELCSAMPSQCEVITVADAISLLGRTLSLELIHHFLVKSQLVNKLPALEKLISFVAHRSHQRAVVAQFLSELSQLPFDSTMAYEAGLFFRIGDLAMLQAASEWVENEAHLANLQFVAERESFAVGLNLMQSWGFPNYLSDVLQQTHINTQSRNSDVLDYSQIVMTAQLILSRLYQPSEKTEKMLKTSSAYSRMMASMPHSESQVVELCQNVLDELKKARMAFMAAA